MRLSLLLVTVAPEPWANRLIREGNGRLFLDERTLWPNGQFVDINLIVSTKFLHNNQDVVKNWVRAQVELTDWIRLGVCHGAR